MELTQLEINHTPFGSRKEQTRPLHDLATTKVYAPKRKAGWIAPVAVLVATIALPVIAVISLPA